MINTFDDFCLYVYVIVDDLWRRSRRGWPNRDRRLSAATANLITMLLVGNVGAGTWKPI